MASVPGMSEAGRKLVAEAVGAAEAQTSGEIVTILAGQSDDYADVALAWSAGVALLALGVLAAFAPFYVSQWDRVLGLWGHEWTPHEVLEAATLVATAKFLGTWLILQYRPLRLWLVPGPLKHRRVRARAVTCFKVGAERRTTGRTGVLIYLSLAEHRAEIVADAAINSKVAPEIWGDALAAMLAEIRQGRMAEGIAAAVDRVGAVLAQHFPRADGDVNELPDRLIEV